MGLNGFYSAEEKHASFFSAEYLGVPSLSGRE